MSLLKVLNASSRLCFWFLMCACVLFAFSRWLWQTLRTSSEAYLCTPWWGPSSTWPKHVPSCEVFPVFRAFAIFCQGSRCLPPHRLFIHLCWFVLIYIYTQSLSFFLVFSRCLFFLLRKHFTPALMHNNQTYVASEWKLLLGWTGVGSGVGWGCWGLLFASPKMVNASPSIHTEPPSLAQLCSANNPDWIGSEDHLQSQLIVCCLHVACLWA